MTPGKAGGLFGERLGNCSRQLLHALLYLPTSMWVACVALDCQLPAQSTAHIPVGVPPRRMFPTPLSTIAPAFFYLRPSMGSYLLHPWSRATMQSSKARITPC